MKADIHPQYFPEAKVTCACGNVFTIGSTKEKFEVEICSNCHPFYTGNDKVIDAAGRVERFKVRAAKVGAKKPLKKTVSKKS
ncbi:MAG: 50S ribosomal protein L31 [bacterium]|nr:50S ribosomal protein L31 [bacterium]